MSDYDDDFEDYSDSFDEEDAKEDPAPPVPSVDDAGRQRASVLANMPRAAGRSAPRRSDETAQSSRETAPQARPQSREVDEGTQGSRERERQLAQQEARRRKRRLAALQRRVAAVRSFARLREESFRLAHTPSLAAVDVYQRALAGDGGIRQVGTQSGARLAATDAQTEDVVLAHRAVQFPDDIGFTNPNMLGEAVSSVVSGRTFRLGTGDGFSVVDPGQGSAWEGDGAAPRPAAEPAEGKAGAGATDEATSASDSKTGGGGGGGGEAKAEAAGPASPSRQPAALPSVAEDALRVPALLRFLARAGDAAEVVLEENLAAHAAVAGGAKAKPLRRGKPVTRSKSLQLAWDGRLAGRRVVALRFLTSKPRSLVVAYQTPRPRVALPAKGEAPSADAFLAAHGLVCVWDLAVDRARPAYVLLCPGDPTAVAVSPGRESVVLAGTADGTLLAWDLRESAFHHRLVLAPTASAKPVALADAVDVRTGLRLPSFSTAAAGDAHAARILRVACVSRGDGDAGGAADAAAAALFQVLSLDDRGAVHTWTAMQSSQPAGAADGSQRPGSRVRLSHGARLDAAEAYAAQARSIALDAAAAAHPATAVAESKDPSADSPAAADPWGAAFAAPADAVGDVACDLAVPAGQSTRLFVGVHGAVLHLSRFASASLRPPRLPLPRACDGARVASLCASSLVPAALLAGFDDDTIGLYNADSGALCWVGEIVAPRRAARGGGGGALTLEWSRSRPCVFYVLAPWGTVHVFDLLACELGEVTTIVLSADNPATSAAASLPSQLGSSYPAAFATGTNDGTVHVTALSAPASVELPQERAHLLRLLATREGVQ